MNTKNSPMYQIHPFNNLEEKIYEPIFEELEWSYDDNDRIIRSNFLPILAGNKNIKRYRKYTRNEFNLDTDILFRPLKVNKHCDFIIQELYNSDEFEVSRAIINKDDSNHYSGKFLDSDDEVICETNFKYFNEIECKFALIYLYLVGYEPKPQIIEVFNHQKELTKSKKKKS